MSQPYVGEIRMFAGNFAPAGWAFCAGQLLPISENDVLFQLIGTTYGGDGQETFALPSLASRVPIHMGNGAGKSSVIGELSGAETTTLTTNQIPAHTHPLIASTAAGTSNSPAGAVFAAGSTIKTYAVKNPSVPMAAEDVTQTGGSQPHDNLQPYLAVNFIISLFGVFPSQN